MSERDTNSNGIQINAPLGLNERAAPNALPLGEWAMLEGLYPAQAGLLERIPGKKLFLKLNSPIWSIYQPNDGSGNIFIQTRDALHRFTLDELLGRQSTPSLTYTDGSLNPDNPPLEETMSMAILVQCEPNNTPGGSIRGVQIGSDTTSLANTFYARRLTHMLVNESSTVQTANVSENPNEHVGQFVLSEGSYRITAHLTYCSVDQNTGVCAGLFNVTNGEFEVHAGSTRPILATVARATGGTVNLTCVIDTAFDVTGGSKTFEIRHKVSPINNQPNVVARNVNLCGLPDRMTSADVNNGAPDQYYAYIKLLKTA